MCIGNLNKKRFQITISMRNASGLYFTVALVVACIAANPRNKMFG